MSGLRKKASVAKLIGRTTNTTAANEAGKAGPHRHPQPPPFIPPSSSSASTSTSSSALSIRSTSSISLRSLSGSIKGMIGKMATASNAIANPLKRRREEDDDGMQDDDDGVLVEHDDAERDRAAVFMAATSELVRRSTSDSRPASIVSCNLPGGWSEVGIAESPSSAGLYPSMPELRAPLVDDGKLDKDVVMDTAGSEPAQSTVAPPSVPNAAFAAAMADLNARLAAKHQNLPSNFLASVEQFSAGVTSHANEQHATSSTSGKHQSQSESTSDRFKSAHDKLFKKSDSIANHYATLRSAPKKLVSAVAAAASRKGGPASKRTAGRASVARARAHNAATASTSKVGVNGTAAPSAKRQRPNQNATTSAITATSVNTAPARPKPGPTPLATLAAPKYPVSPIKSNTLTNKASTSTLKAKASSSTLRAAPSSRSLRPDVSESTTTAASDAIGDAKGSDIAGAAPAKDSTSRKYLDVLATPPRPAPGTTRGLGTLATATGTRTTNPSLTRVIKPASAVPSTRMKLLDVFATPPRSSSAAPNTNKTVAGSARKNDAIKGGARTPATAKSVAQRRFHPYGGGGSATSMRTNKAVRGVGGIKRGSASPQKKTGSASAGTPAEEASQNAQAQTGSEGTVVHFPAAPTHDPTHASTTLAESTAALQALPMPPQTLPVRRPHIDRAAIVRRARAAAEAAEHAAEGDSVGSTTAVDVVMAMDVDESKSDATNVDEPQAGTEADMSKSRTTVTQPEKEKEEGMPPPPTTLSSTSTKRVGRTTTAASSTAKSSTATKSGTPKARLAPTMGSAAPAVTLSTGLSARLPSKKNGPSSEQPSKGRVQPTSAGGKAATVRAVAKGPQPLPLPPSAPVLVSRASSSGTIARGRAQLAGSVRGRGVPASASASASTVGKVSVASTGREASAATSSKHGEDTSRAVLGETSTSSQFTTLGGSLSSTSLELEKETEDDKATLEETKPKAGLPKRAPSSVSTSTTATSTTTAAGLGVSTRRTSARSASTASTSKTSKAASKTATPTAKTTTASDEEDGENVSPSPGAASQGGSMRTTRASARLAAKGRGAA